MNIIVSHYKRKKVNLSLNLWSKIFKYHYPLTQFAICVKYDEPPLGGDFDYKRARKLMSIKYKDRILERVLELSYEIFFRNKEKGKRLSRKFSIINERLKRYINCVENLRIVNIHIKRIKKKNNPKHEIEFINKINHKRYFLGRIIYEHHSGTIMVDDNNCYERLDITICHNEDNEKIARSIKAHLIKKCDYILNEIKSTESYE